MKILYVTTRAPYPPHKGDQLIAYEQIRNLTRDNEIYLITYIDSLAEKAEIEAEIGPYCKKIYYLHRSKIKSAINALKSMYNFKPLQVNMFVNKENSGAIENVLKEVEPDVIHIQTVRMAEYFVNVNKPKVVDMIDALSLNMKRRSEKEKLLLKPVFEVESSMLKKYESDILEKFDKVVLVSKKDKEYFNNKKIEINPNGTYITKGHLEKYKSIEKEKAFIFHGNMQYFPNVEAVMFFAAEIWPVIHKKYPEYKFYIAGKDPVSKVKALDGKDNIVVTGFVEDICEYLCKSEIGIYPLNSGTGMQNKILEALACGLPTIVSPLAIQGIEDITSEQVLIGENKDKIIENIVTLVENEKLREEYSKKGQNFILENYSWKKNVSRLESIWKEAIKNKLQ